MGKIGTASASAADLAEPETASALLRLLHVEHESVARQWPAITAWLSDHRPSTSLRCSLRANGYGYLLREAILSSGERLDPIGTISTIAAPHHS